MVLGLNVKWVVRRSVAHVICVCAYTSLGARLFYMMTRGHFGRLEKKINLTDTFIVDIDISTIKDEL